MRWGRSVESEEGGGRTCASWYLAAHWSCVMWSASLSRQPCRLSRESRGERAADDERLERRLLSCSTPPRQLCGLAELLSLLGAASGVRIARPGASVCDSDLALPPRRLHRTNDIRLDLDLVRPVRLGQDDPTSSKRPSRSSVPPFVVTPALAAHDELLEQGPRRGMGASPSPCSCLPVRMALTLCIAGRASSDKG